MTKSGPFALLVLCVAASFTAAQAPRPGVGEGEPSDTAPGSSLRERIEATPRLPYVATTLLVKPPFVGWASGALSWVTVDSRGHIYELQRGTQADPILEINREGELLRSWGKGDFVMPHSLRIDPSGHVWTVDASSSQLIEYTRDGRKLSTVRVGGQPQNGSTFNGATDVAFGRNRDLFVTDGYGNARVLHFAADGRLLQQWGRHGAGPGELDLPHALQIDSQGTLYVADRENGRIELFDSKGAYRGAFNHLGRVYALKLAGDILWVTMGDFAQAPGSGEVWIVTLDRRTGRMLGHLDVPGQRAGHALDLMPSGEPVVTAGDGLLLFRHESKGARKEESLPQ